MPSNDCLHVKKAPVIRFYADTTVQWPMRDGDSLLWSRCPVPWAAPRSAARFTNVWNLRDGDSVLLTNRVVDIPDWFELHTTDVCNAQCYAAEPRLKAAASWFATPSEGQHIWRVREGDRLVWIGDPREGLEGKDGVLAVLDCLASALVLGVPPNHSEPALSAFGTGLNNKTPPLVLCDRVQLAEEAIRNLGPVRTMNMNWRMGDGEDAPPHLPGPTEREQYPSSLRTKAWLQ